MDEFDAWIETLVREVDSNSVPFTSSINEEQTMWKPIDVLRIDGNVFRICLLMMKRQSAQRHGNVRGLRVLDLTYSEEKQRKTPDHVAGSID